MNAPWLRSRRTAVASLAGLMTGAVLTLPPADAEACGCFAPPDPSVPVVQAGERILFSHEDGNVTAHIQIQYEGEAAEFGWLLPLPSVPTLELGVDELFTQLINTTQPLYRVTRVTDDKCEWANFLARAGGSPASDSASPPPESDDIAVVQDSIGPYDYAVLRADTRDEMFDWLVRNSYFIPQGTEDVVGPYIHQGAYFLALKLRSGNDAGDIAPVVVRYASDLPMIPIILTSVAANPDMGIQVWILGDSRAIPRNYRHTVLNEEHIDWFSAASNYNEVIINATNEAEDGQSFVTEYAGPSDVMRGVLDWDRRFGTKRQFEAITDASSYVSALRANGFIWDSVLINHLKRAFPFPDRVRSQGVTEDEYYQQLDFYLGFYRERNPRLFEGYEFEFDAVELTGELWERIVEPTLAAGALFRKYPKLTRLYTTLSPEEMTKDPVFSFNPELPDVSNVHEATYTYLCGSGSEDPLRTPGVLALPDGRKFYLENETQWATRNRNNVPYSRRIEFLREEGAPVVEVDNSTRLTPGESEPRGCACSARETRERGASVALLLGLTGLLGLRASRRRAGSGGAPNRAGAE